MSTTIAITCGVDEAGRGPLAGPVMVAAVVLDPSRPIDGLDDSKKLTARRRESLNLQIRQQALHFSLIAVEASVIDELNILQATLQGMQRAIAALNTPVDLALIDGNRCPDSAVACQAVIGGDALHPCISAASILAKTERDRYMRALHQQFPCYGFDRHKGYPTRDHLDALMRHGPCVAHRRSFAPVRRSLQAALGLEGAQ